MYRVAIFIDGSYLDNILQHELNGARIDFAKMSRAIAQQIHSDADILRSYYYHCLPYQGDPPTPDERQRFAAAQNFFAAIHRLPRFVVKAGRLARRGPDKDGKYFYQQKMVDTLLSIDLVQLSVKRGITHAVVVAGDSDFVPAMEVARNESISVWLFHGGRVHNSLRDAADERVRITQSFVDSVPWKK